MKTTTHDLINSRIIIIDWFKENGGKTEFLRDFMLAVKETVEFELAPDSTIFEICEDCLYPRFQGIAEKTNNSIREKMGNLRFDQNTKTFSKIY